MEYFTCPWSLGLLELCPGKLYHDMRDMYHVKGSFFIMSYDAGVMSRMTFTMLSNMLLFPDGHGCVYHELGCPDRLYHTTGDIYNALLYMYHVKGDLCHVRNDVYHVHIYLYHVQLSMSMDAFTMSWDTYIMFRETIPYNGGHCQCQRSYNFSEKNLECTSQMLPSQHVQHRTTKMRACSQLH
jgi:hypothetical protein